MSARTKSAMTEAQRRHAPEEPEINPVDDALWHLQTEIRRVARLIGRHGLDPAQRRDLQRALAALRAAADWQPARSREAEPAL